MSEKADRARDVVFITSDESLCDIFPPEAWEQCEKIVLEPEQFDAFMAELDNDRPARALPRLSELFSQPSPFEEETK